MHPDFSAKYLAYKLLDLSQLCLIYHTKIINIRIYLKKRSPVIRKDPQSGCSAPLLILEHISYAGLPPTLG